MAKVLSFVATDTPISGVTTNPLNLGLVNWGADWTEKFDSKRGEVILTNTKAPLGSPEILRISASDVEDIYKGTGIDPSYRSLSKRGRSLLLQLSIILRETDTTDSTYERLIPMTVHLVGKFPEVDSLTGDIALSVIRRMLASVVETGVNTSSRVVQLLRGALVPSDVK